ncbi:MerR family transcriptional regulator [Sulfitobacter mediterraneus]|uniref:MerR family transcriptional regulator n=1 Tax=Sulfitobacter mediterraneus TaxID=83219 RepID=UPI001931AC32|nr:MerR family transcriptional regulator [Sulfitobacter mediterraneus]MBM1309630.1 MerR family transcriptional regulator [Sulfitobacter mediterraneus]MBM1313515.1 MerR family transcriptional regulator [Sulfitobacter mediterraneus]MBM1321899.1 MerR family transcriptional regulator [Sulfitobacter mediterraneus]MBM1325786.1 MerR family transcriptional regulator [Sulfitobacter mediterraneus]MBM1397132.1 MerR family transcriptional regulator [Sulfitobacter mediterraneus]
MQAKEAAERLEITQRMLRHYEKEGLLTVDRTLNGYRHYTNADLRRAGRIRDFIASGFSTREIRAMSACLSDDGDGPCEGGVEMLKQKLANIDRLRDDLTQRRATVLDRLEVLEQALAREAALAARITEDS